MKNKLTKTIKFISPCLALCLALSGCANANTNESPSSDIENPSGSENDSNSEFESESDGTEIYDDNDVDPDDGGENNTEDGSGTQEPDVNNPEDVWANRVVADVSSVLNVRKEPKSDAAIVGKMEGGAYGVVVERGEEWTKIISGNVEGYIATKYCAFGEDARVAMEKRAGKIAIVNGKNLRLRDKASTKGHVMTKLSKGTELVVNTSVKEVDGWVAVYYGEGTYYISAEYAIIKAKEQTALTTAEKKAQDNAAKKLKDKQEATMQAAKEQIALDEATDLELLATIIWCESGAEPYEAQLAVGACVVNRKEHKNYPNTIKKVILQKNQFSPVGSGWFIKALMRGDASASCYKAAKAALAGEDNTNGCRSFRKASTGRPGVVYGKIVFFSNN